MERSHSGTYSEFSIQWKDLGFPATSLYELKFWITITNDASVKVRLTIQTNYRRQKQKLTEMPRQTEFMV